MIKFLTESNSPVRYLVKDYGKELGVSNAVDLVEPFLILELREPVQ